jgi:hypothetical protein
MWEKRILLRATESMQLVNKEERLLAVCAALRRSGDRLAHFGHAVTCCGEAGGDGANSGGDHRRKR